MGKIDSASPTKGLKCNRCSMLDAVRTAPRLSTTLMSVFVMVMSLLLMPMRHWPTSVMPAFLVCNIMFSIVNIFINILSFVLDRFTKKKENKIVLALQIISSVYIGVVIAAVCFSLGLKLIKLDPLQKYSYQPSSPDAPRRRIAVVGGGMSGMGAAMTMNEQPDRFEYEMFESYPQLGGHAYAPAFQYTHPNGTVLTTHIDMGFIYGDMCGYNSVRHLMEHFGVNASAAKLSFSTRLINGTVTYLTDSAPHADVEEFDRFREEILQVFPPDAMTWIKPFRVWLDERGFDDEFKANYLAPMFMTLFITKTGMFELPTAMIAEMFYSFVDLFHATPAWVVEGSSHSLYEKLTEAIDQAENGRYYLNTAVESVTRLPVGEGENPDAETVRITLANGTSVEYDGVVLGVAANVAKDMLAKGGSSNTWEQWVLGMVRYDPTTMILHTDRRCSPEKREEWRNFNFVRYGSEFASAQDFSFSAVMSDVYGLDLDEDNSEIPFLSTNLEFEVPAEKIHDSQTWEHHSGDMLHYVMEMLFYEDMQARGNVAFAGEWMFSVGHEMAFLSGASAIQYLGATLDDERMQALSDKHDRMDICYPRELEPCPPENELNNSHWCYMDYQRQCGGRCRSTEGYSSIFQTTNLHAVGHMFQPMMAGVAVVLILLDVVALVSFGVLLVNRFYYSKATKAPQYDAAPTKESKALNGLDKRDSENYTRVDTELELEQLQRDKSDE